MTLPLTYPGDLRIAQSRHSLRLFSITGYRGNSISPSQSAYQRSPRLGAAQVPPPFVPSYLPVAWRYSHVPCAIPSETWVNSSRKLKEFDRSGRCPFWGCKSRGVDRFPPFPRSLLLSSPSYLQNSSISELPTAHPKGHSIRAKKGHLW
jgi:hypothetical protein